MPRTTLSRNARRAGNPAGKAQRPASAKRAAAPAGAKRKPGRDAEKPAAGRGAGGRPAGKAAPARQRRPGRPSGESADAVRHALIDAARALCIETGLDAATTKAIARRAGVNPAMINYYFGSKEGLGRTMMLDSMQPVLERLDAASGAAARGALTLDAFLDGYMGALAQNPWLPQLVVREVLPANGRFRELFFDEIALRAGRVLAGVVAATRHARDADDGVDEALVPVTVASIAVFPFLAAPVVEGVLGVDPFDDEIARRIVTHSKALLRRAFGMEAAE